jgi:hypothetical protein
MVGAAALSLRERRADEPRENAPICFGLSDQT